ncbi:MAG TPA: ECF transporter S component [Clostridia bacterium]|nr:ECF transporter S component [Clostridia bacterium]
MSNKTNTQKTLIMAQIGVLSALITVMTFVPYVGYISYGGLSITLLHIPVIIGAIVMGPKWGSVLGGVWGVTCILKAVLAPPTPLEGIIFRNPIIALIPRILVGLVAGLLFKYFNKGLINTSISLGFTAAFATAVNTALVMGGIYLFYSEEVGISTISFGGLTKFILAAFGMNAVLEIIICIILTIPICNALRKIKTKV